MTETHPQGALEPGYRLLWYRIGRILGRGAFGVTYLAEDINLHRPVAIKEFFPSQYSSRRSDSAEIRPLSEKSAEDFRWAMERFLSEGRTLAHFEHPNIIRVLNVFEQNGTAYMVMHYESGISLSALLKKRRTLNEDELTRLLVPLLDGLEKVHSTGFIHRDIKPSNIYIREGGSPVLLDFGSARQSMKEYTQTLTSLVSPGYAPIEQYTSKGDRQGPWTDIYGMGATLYRAVTGLVPPSAIDRSEALSEGKEDYMTRASDLARAPYGKNFLNAVDHALAFSVDARPQSIANWRTEFGFDLGDIDTQPDYNISYGSGQSDYSDDDSESPTKTEYAGPPGQVEDNDFINIADSEAGTAVNTHSTVQAVDNAEVDPESPTQRADEPANRRVRHYRPFYTAASAVVVLIAGLLLFNLPGGDSTPADGSGGELVETVRAIEQQTEPGETATLTEAQIDSLLAAAREDMDAMRLTTPEDNNAYDKFRRILAIDENNTSAQRGIQAIYNRYMQLAQQAMQADEFDKANNMLKRAGDVMPQGPGLMRARVALEQQRSERAMESLNRTMGTGEQEAAPTADNGEAAPSTSEAFRQRLGGQ